MSLFCGGLTVSVEMLLAPVVRSISSIGRAGDQVQRLQRVKYLPLEWTTLVEVSLQGQGQGVASATARKINRNPLWSRTKTLDSTVPDKEREDRVQI